MTLPILFHLGSKSTLYSWKVWTEGADILTEYGQVDGKKQTSRKTAVTKNIGKSNETTPEDQAVKEAKSLWTFKVERKYKESAEEAKEVEIFLPMLADTFEKRHGKKKEADTYPSSIQQKLDGVRCLAFWEGSVVQLMSRGGKTWDLPHISTWLETRLPQNLVLDGEIYIHGHTFQAITRLVKKHRPETTDLKLHVYDCVMMDDRDAQWPVRLNRINDFATETTNDSPVTVVETLTAASREEVYEIQSDMMVQGYEGAIVRCHDNSEYRFGYRSKRLLKVKSFDHNEFKVVGHTNDGVGKNKNCILWVCATPEGETFEATPTGPYSHRRSLIDTAEEQVGKMLRVKYHGLTEDGKPKFAVGEGFRLPEDM